MAIKNFNVGVKAAIVNDGKLLVLKHSTKGFWDLPGGRIDETESILDTLQRELDEELPSHQLINIGQVVCAYRVPGSVFDDGTGLLLLVYMVEAKFKNDHIEISSEHSEYDWMTLEEASVHGSHIVKQTVKQLASRIQ